MERIFDMDLRRRALDEERSEESSPVAFHLRTRHGIPTTIGWSHRRIVSKFYAMCLLRQAG